MSVIFSELVGKIGADGAISSDDILKLRQEAWPDGQISADEAEAIFALNRQLEDKSADWVAFFVEAIGEYVLNQREPTGYVDDQNSAWLIAQIDADGQLCSMAELELLLRVFERALNVPQSLKDYATAQIEKAVIEGVGPTCSGGALEAGNVNAVEARLLRRAIFAPSSERPAAVGRKEAELLFRLKDATLTADNAPEWKQLFVQGVANYLQGYCSANAQISRERSAELNACLDDTSVNIGRFLARAAKSSPNALGIVFGRKPDAQPHDASVADAHAITETEQAWLDARVHADGTIDAYEQALLDFLAEE